MVTPWELCTTFSSRAVQIASACSGESSCSAAAKAGFKSSMAITHVNGNRVSSPKEFYTAVEKAIGPVSLRITGATANATEDLIVAAD